MPKDRKPGLASRLAQEDRETREMAKPLLALIQHAFDQLQTRNQKLILTRVLKKKAFQLEEVLRQSRH